jgi:hypothetical protein
MSEGYWPEVLQSWVIGGRTDRREVCKACVQMTALWVLTGDCPLQNVEYEPAV